MKSLFLFLSLLSQNLWAERAPEFKGGVFEPAYAAPDFELHGSKGSKVKLSQFRGKVVVLKFGFTNCATVCPTTMGHLSYVFKELGDAVKDVQMLFVTVDPKRDTPQKMKEWLGNFNSNFIGATGSDKKLNEINKKYGIFVTKAKDQLPGYEIHHSSSIYLIDREGKLRVLIPYGKTGDDILHDIRRLLKKS